jgi:ABC-type amino acid transport substrate-binding protein
MAAGDAVMRTILAMLAERGLADDAAIDAARVLRASLHGFVTLEAAGGFGLPRDVDRTYERLVAWLDRGLEALDEDGRVSELRLALTVPDFPRALGA